MRNMRLHVAVAAVVVGLASSTSAATYNATATGNWNVPSTWTSADNPGTTPSSITDTVNIGDGFTVTIPGDGDAANSNLDYFTGGAINLSGTGVLTCSDSYDGSQVALLLNMNGGRFNTGSGNKFGGGRIDGVWSSAPQSIVSISGTATVYTGNSDGATFGRDGGAADSLKITGSGTLVKLGNSALTLDAGNTATNQSDFSGTYDIQAGTLDLKHQKMLQTASVRLNNSNVLLTFGGTGAGTVGYVNNLTGSGTVSFASSAGYSRDLHINAGGVLSPGGIGTAGTITKNTNYGQHDLVFDSSGEARSTLDLDILSAGSADKLVWKDSVANAALVSAMDFANGILKIRLYTPAIDAPVTETGSELSPLSWILVDGDELGAGQYASAGSTAIQSRPFASVSFVNLDGTALNLYTGAGDLDGTGWVITSGGGNNVDYLGTSGSSNRQVVLGGYYVVPEPAVTSLLVASGMLLSLRRRRA